MAIIRDREEELAARLDMLVEEHRLTAEDLLTFAEQARERAALMRAEAKRIRERAHLQKKTTRHTHASRER
jgi:hypothetical protein